MTYVSVVGVFTFIMMFAVGPGEVLINSTRTCQPAENRLGPIALYEILLFKK